MKRGVNQVSEECLFLESQRDSATKPRVARHELPWGKGSKQQNPNGVSALVNVSRRSQPRWGCCFSRFLPRVVRASPVLRSSGPRQSEADVEATAERGELCVFERKPVHVFSVLPASCRQKRMRSHKNATITRRSASRQYPCQRDAGSTLKHGQSLWDWQPSETN